jgi:hypothetical protein
MSPPPPGLKRKFVTREGFRTYSRSPRYCTVLNGQEGLVPVGHIRTVQWGKGGGNILLVVAYRGMGGGGG